jgi:cell division protein WhiA
MTLLRRPASKPVNAMSKQLTFSHKIKDELSALPCHTACCRKAEIGAAFFASGRFAGDAVTLATANAGWAARLGGLIREQYRSEGTWSAHNDLLILCLERPDADSGTPGNRSLLSGILDDMKDLFGFDPATGNGTLRHSLPSCCRQSILRALFLSCGSISEPVQAYHLELAIKNPDAARMAVQLLRQFGIAANILPRHGHMVVYLNEGQNLADYLAYAGAHRSLLSLESLRVEKEIRNSVNRAVNCDNANSQRIANTSVRQIELIRAISSTGELEMLPPDLKATAEARLEHPDLSIAELGELMNPPLGKSGMNHRLRRLESLAAERLSILEAAAHGGSGSA